VGEGLRSALAVEAFRHTGAYDARIAAELPARMAAAGSAACPTSRACPARPIRIRRRWSSAWRRSRRCATARTRTSRRPATAVPGRRSGPGRSPLGGSILQGKALSYNNVLDASGAYAIARQLRGPAVVIVKHTNPCGAAERATLAEAWQDALAGDPVSAYGGVVALTREVDAATAAGLASIFLEVIVAPAYSAAALEILSKKPNLRLLEDRSSAPRRPRRRIPIGSLRVAGGGVLVTAPDVLPDDPATWKRVTSRARPPQELRDLDLAWRLCRGVVSNAIVLVKDGMEIGLGSGQTSRVDAARQAVAKAIAFHGPESLKGAACGSDAFYPFPDAVEVCLEAGVSAFAQPGGSMRDAEVIAVAEAAGAAMMVTGVRHFRH
jgi:phosphoribosylaminoimidazolecarboxamide formyltransferase/IMP cyclohydrolase